MERKIRKAAVIGSGVMGAGIAAHLANVGISTLLLDIVPREITPDLAKKGVKEARSSIAQSALDRMLKTKPAPLFTKASSQHIVVGNIEDDLGKVSEVDWIIEVVVENLQVKRALFEKIEQYWKPGTVVSSNTSGVSINAMIEGRTDAFRSHFLGTHFFNPPRYMKLLEIIPANDTSLEIVQQMVSFSESILGKGVVIAKDTPNFIANRIGVHGLLATIDVMKEHGLTPDEVDSVTGPALGRPRSATFRTLDMVGLDTFVHVANNVYDNVNDDEEKLRFIVPEFLKNMVSNGWIGEKSGQGFYKKVKSDIFTLQYETMDYEPKRKLREPSLEATKTAKDVESRVRTLVYSDDKAGKLAWEIVKKTLLYTASKVPEIADDIVSIDQAMKWGFNWDLGPFELWDAIGVKKSVERMKAEGETIPVFVRQLLESGKSRFYEKTVDHKQFYTVSGLYDTKEQHPKIINLQDLKERNRVIKSN
ncbi:MAG: 3-hydroxyacyl-CoA dehydrogenase NAD-binding domain-containing protein, partial [Bacilli bacterium]